jgi:hypothetical protein
VRQYGRTTEWKAARMIARREGGEVWAAWCAAHPGGVPTDAEVAADIRAQREARAAARKAAEARGTGRRPTRRGGKRAAGAGQAGGGGGGGSSDGGVGFRSPDPPGRPRRRSPTPLCLATPLCLRLLTPPCFLSRPVASVRRKARYLRTTSCATLICCLLRPRS